jgi:hypothetical protein
VALRVLQRECPCGGETHAGGECAECRKKRHGVLQRRAAPGLDHEYAASAKPLRESRFNADLSRVRSRSLQPASASFDAQSNGATDDPIHQPLVEEFRRREGRLGNPAAGELSEGVVKYRGLTSSCPARTAVDRVVDLTPAGLSDGFATAYGAMTVMRVYPGERTWDGTHLREELTTVSDTCPATFSPDPQCSGTSSFTVGDPGKTARADVQPGLVNRFYDFHISRHRTISRLHDPTRNPAGVAACQTVCEQKYFCEDRELGKHTITRDFRKGKFGGKAVTLVTVTKT